MLRPLGADTGVHKEAWSCYYWAVNRFIVLIGLTAARYPNRDEVDNLFTDYALIQTVAFLLYYVIGSIVNPKWLNDTAITICCMMIAGLFALIIMWRALREKAK